MSTKELARVVPQEVLDLKRGKTNFTDEEAFRILEYTMPGVEKTEPTGLGAKMAAELERDGLAPRGGKRKRRR